MLCEQIWAAWRNLSERIWAAKRKHFATDIFVVVKTIFIMTDDNLRRICSKTPFVLIRGSAPLVLRHIGGIVGIMYVAIVPLPKTLFTFIGDNIICSQTVTEGPKGMVWFVRRHQKCPKTNFCVLVLLGDLQVLIRWEHLSAILSPNSFWLLRYVTSSESRSFSFPYS